MFTEEEEKNGIRKRDLGNRKANKEKERTSKRARKTRQESSP
jgi:hypothetical protein